MSTKRRKRDIHVVPAGGRTAFVPKTAKGRRLVECPRTQTEAIAIAVRAARRRRVEVVIHRPDGRIRGDRSAGQSARAVDATRQRPETVPSIILSAATPCPPSPPEP